MGKRILAATVNITGEDGEVSVHKAGTTPPAAVAKQITNPSAWTEEADADPADALGDAEAGSGGPSDDSDLAAALGGKPPRSTVK